MPVTSFINCPACCTDCCVTCDHDASSEFFITASGVTNGLQTYCNTFNAKLILEHGTGCFWNASALVNGVTQAIWTMTFSDPIVSLVSYNNDALYQTPFAGWDCKSPLTLVKVGGNNLSCTNFPASITVTPVPGAALVSRCFCVPPGKTMGPLIYAALGGSLAGYGTVPLTQVGPGGFYGYDLENPPVSCTPPTPPLQPPLTRLQAILQCSSPFGWSFGVTIFSSGTTELYVNDAFQQYDTGGPDNNPTYEPFSWSGLLANNGTTTCTKNNPATAVLFEG